MGQPSIAKELLGLFKEGLLKDSSFARVFVVDVRTINQLYELTNAVTVIEIYKTLPKTEILVANMFMFGALNDEHDILDAIYPDMLMLDTTAGRAHIRGVVSSYNGSSLDKIVSNIDKVFSSTHPVFDHDFMFECSVCNRSIPGVRYWLEKSNKPIHALIEYEEWVAYDASVSRAINDSINSANVPNEYKYFSMDDVVT